MKFWKLGLALSLTVAFGLTACEDSSTSTTDNNGGEYKPGTIGCTIVEQGATYVQETRMDDFTVKMTLERTDDGVVTEIYEFNQTIPADTCDFYSNKIGTEYAKVDCKDKTIKAENAAKMESADFETFAEAYASVCKYINGTKIPDSMKDDDGKIKTPDIEKCSADNKDKEIEVIKGSGVFVTCDGEKWVPAKTECQGDAKVDIATITLACKDSKWTISSDTECEDGKTDKKTFSGVEVSATCVDGVWVVDAKAETEEEGETEGEETTEAEE